MLLDLGHIQHSPARDAGSKEIANNAHNAEPNACTAGTTGISSYLGVAETNLPLSFSLSFPISDLRSSPAAVLFRCDACKGTFRPLSRPPLPSKTHQALQPGWQTD